MKATISYSLNAVGQKASLLSGGDGKSMQMIDVPRECPEFADVVELGQIDKGGNVTLHFSDYPEAAKFSRPQTAAELVAAKRAALAAADVEKNAAKDRLREETLAVLAAKKTCKKSYVKASASEGTVTAYGSVCFDEPDWPYNPDAGVVASAEAQAWIAELLAAKSECEREAQRLANENLAKKLAELAAEKEKAEAAAAARAARRAAMNLEDDQLAFRVENGALMGVPVWERHSRGKNWLAKISINPTSPGGLDREFAEKAKGDAYYILPAFSPGDAVEFGADYYSGSGKKNTTRWYGYVVDLRSFRPAIDEDGQYLVLEKCETGKAAIQAGAKWAETHRGMSVEDQIAAGIAKVNSEATIVPNPSVN